MQHYAHVVDGIARERIDLPDDIKIGVDLFSEDFAAELIACAASVKPGDLYDAQTKTWSSPPPPPPLPIPDVSSAQAKIQLRRAGLRDKVDAAIKAADGEVQDWFSDARTWQRTNPHVVAIGAALDLTSDEIDALFRQAAAIAA
ncbi:hypothetical protein [Methylobacterium sp. Gmos1]